MSRVPKGNVKPGSKTGSETSTQGPKAVVNAEPEAMIMAMKSEMRYPIVGVGASAGGLGAFRTLLQSLPDDSGMSFVLIQHLDPKHESLMPNILGKVTRMPVLEAENGMLVEPNHIYMIPPNHHLDLDNYTLKLTKFEDGRLPRLSIDHFFASLALTHFECAIGIVLSGTGSDGTQGIREIKAAGGLTIAQDPMTAEFEGMPGSAVATGQVDQILPLERWQKH